MIKQKQVEDLVKLNSLAKKNAYSIDDLDWTQELNKDLLWAPPSMGPLTYLPSFELLNDAQKLRYNQLFAMAICEQFIWFESNFLIDTMESVLNDFEVPEELKLAARFLKDEEIKHTLMFWRLLQKAEPDWYLKESFQIFNIGLTQKVLIKGILSLPKTLLVWLWIAIFFEERTTDYCRQYVQYHKKHPDHLDFSFLQIHKFHFKDEARHFQLDQHLLNYIYDKAPLWKRNLAGKMFFQVMKGYTSPKRTSIHTIQKLVEEFPDLKEKWQAQIIQELPLLGKSEPYHQMAFSKEAVGNSLHLFSQYPELDTLWPLFIVEEKGSFIPS